VIGKEYIPQMETEESGFKATGMAQTIEDEGQVIPQRS
jgi:hypothetical protein